jgi:hypothetical protein
MLEKHMGLSVVVDGNAEKFRGKLHKQENLMKKMLSKYLEYNDSILDIIKVSAKSASRETRTARRRWLTSQATQEDHSSKSVLGK